MESEAAESINTTTTTTSILSSSSPDTSSASQSEKPSAAMVESAPIVTEEEASIRRLRPPSFRNNSSSGILKRPSLPLLSTSLLDVSTTSTARDDAEVATKKPTGRRSSPMASSTPNHSFLPSAPLNGGLSAASLNEPWPVTDLRIVPNDGKPAPGNSSFLLPCESILDTPIHGSHRLLIERAPGKSLITSICMIFPSLNESVPLGYRPISTPEAIAITPTSPVSAASASQPASSPMSSNLGLICVCRGDGPPIMDVGLLPQVVVSSPQHADWTIIDSSPRVSMKALFNGDYYLCVKYAMGDFSSLAQAHNSSGASVVSTVSSATSLGTPKVSNLNSSLLSQSDASHSKRGQAGGVVPPRIAAMLPRAVMSNFIRRVGSASPALGAHSLAPSSSASPPILARSGSTGEGLASHLDTRLERARQRVKKRLATVYAFAEERLGKHGSVFDPDVIWKCVEEEEEEGEEGESSIVHSMYECLVGSLESQCDALKSLTGSLTTSKHMQDALSADENEARSNITLGLFDFVCMSVAYAAERAHFLVLAAATEFFVEAAKSGPRKWHPLSLHFMLLTLARGIDASDATENVSAATRSALASLLASTGSLSEEPQAGGAGSEWLGRVASLGAAERAACVAPVEISTSSTTRLSSKRPSISLRSSQSSPLPLPQTSTCSHPVSCEETCFSLHECARVAQAFEGITNTGASLSKSASSRCRPSVESSLDLHVALSGCPSSIETAMFCAGWLLMFEPHAPRIACSMLRCLLLSPQAQVSWVRARVSELHRSMLYERASLMYWGAKHFSTHSHTVFRVVSSCQSLVDVGDAYLELLLRDSSATSVAVETIFCPHFTVSPTVKQSTENLTYWRDKLVILASILGFVGGMDLENGHMHALNALVQSMGEFLGDTREILRQRCLPLLISTSTTTSSFVAGNPSRSKSTSSSTISSMIGGGSTAWASSETDFDNLESMEEETDEALHQVRRRIAAFLSKSLLSLNVEAIPNEEDWALRVVAATKTTKSLRSGLSELPFTTVLKSRELASFLFRYSSELGLGLTGDFLGSEKEANVADMNDLRDEYVRIGMASYPLTSAMHSSSNAFDSALRWFLTKCGFRLPGEAQKIDRLLSAFARFFLTRIQGASAWSSWATPAVGFSPICLDEDAALMLAFSCVMLNTDLHRAEIKKASKMKKEDFIKNMSGTNGKNKDDFSASLLEELYHRVATHEIKWNVAVPEAAEDASHHSHSSIGNHVSTEGVSCHAIRGRSALLLESCCGEAVSPQDVWRSLTRTSFFEGSELGAASAAYEADEGVDVELERLRLSLGAIHVFGGESDLRTDHRMHLKRGCSFYNLENIEDDGAALEAAYEPLRAAVLRRHRELVTARWSSLLALSSLTPTSMFEKCEKLVERGGYLILFSDTVVHAVSKNGFFNATRLNHPVVWQTMEAWRLSEATVEEEEGGLRLRTPEDASRATFVFRNAEVCASWVESVRELQEALASQSNADPTPSLKIDIPFGTPPSVKKAPPLSKVESEVFQLGGPPRGAQDENHDDNAVLRSAYKRALVSVRGILENPKIDAANKLLVYGLHKQVSRGDCPVASGAEEEEDEILKAKRAAWDAHRGTSTKTAMHRMCLVVRKILALEEEGQA